MKPRIALFCACLLATPAFAAPGVMIKDDDLKAAASAAAASIGRVAKGATVEILARQGGWTQVTSAGKTGWVRILAVKSSAPAAGAGDVLGLVQAGTSKRDPGKVVAVAGLRGLNEEELRQARFNPSELLLLDRYASDRPDAERYAREVGLRPASVAYLPDPKRQPRQENSNPLWGDGNL
jgi:uncharacterized protein YgiM (DUF1202 family)